jgi:hypothetical protein
MNITATETNGKHSARVSAGDAVLFVTPAYYTAEMATSAARCWVAFHGGKCVSTNPRTIRFTTVTCSRCEGERRNPMWGKVAGGWCFQCGGAGWQYTQAGKAALAAYEAMRDERLGTTFGELAVGERYKRNGKWWVKGANGYLTVDPYARVTRHDGLAALQMWKEIAERYPTGAKLIY